MATADTVWRKPKLSYPRSESSPPLWSEVMVSCQVPPSAELLLITSFRTQGLAHLCAEEDEARSRVCSSVTLFQDWQSPRRVLTANPPHHFSFHPQLPFSFSKHASMLEGNAALKWGDTSSVRKVKDFLMFLSLALRYIKMPCFVSLYFQKWWINGSFHVVLLLLRYRWLLLPQEALSLCH